jgi:hypothetical protein
MYWTGTLKGSLYRLLLILMLAQAGAPSVDQIVARSVEALGGAAKFATVDSIKVQGRMRFGQGAFTPFTVIAKRPNLFRMELSIGPDHVTQAFDGAIGWQSVSGEHKQEPTTLTGDSLAHLIDQAANAIGGPLLDLEKRHNTAELVGVEAVNGVNCYQVKITLGTGDTMMVFIDSSTFHETQEELPMQVNGKATIIQQSVGGYRRFGPVLVACLFVTREKGGEDRQRMEIDSVEINPPVETTVFRMPRTE